MASNKLLEQKKIYIWAYVHVHPEMFSPVVLLLQDQLITVSTWPNICVGKALKQSPHDTQ